MGGRSSGEDLGQGVDGPGSAARRSDASDTLQNLASPGAARLYEEILTNSTVPAQTSEASIQELLDFGVVRRANGNPAQLEAIPRSQAIQRLMTHREADLHAKLARLRRGWSRLDALVERAASAADTGSPGGPVEVVNGLGTIQNLITDLYRSARYELRATSTGRFDGELTEDYLLTPSAPAKHSRARFRTIYDNEYAASPTGLRIIQLSIASGEEARIRAHLPTRTLLVDDSIALIALTHTGMQGSALVRSQSLLALLREWFDLLWTAPGTVDAASSAGDELAPRELEVLRLLAVGLTDEAIARAMGVSVKTVRRSVSAVLDALDVSSRFAAGAAAARRQWI